MFQQRGFTLVELMITLAVAVVLLTIAVPSFRTITYTNKLTTAVNDVIASINTAKMEAIKRGGSAQLCSNSATNNSSDTLGSACGTQTSAIYLLTKSTIAEQVRSSTPELTGAVVLKGDMVALRFNGQGLARKVGDTAPYNGPVAMICTTALSTNNQRTITMAAGGILTTSTSSGSCS
jgi:type IV fimbrial biogenesis protein FimT